MSVVQDRFSPPALSQGGGGKVKAFTLSILLRGLPDGSLLPCMGWVKGSDSSGAAERCDQVYKMTPRLIAQPRRPSFGSNSLLASIRIYKGMPVSGSGRSTAKTGYRLIAYGMSGMIMKPIARAAATNSRRRIEIRFIERSCCKGSIFIDTALAFPPCSMI